MACTGMITMSMRELDRLKVIQAAERLQLSERQISRLCRRYEALAAYFLGRLVFSRWPRWVQRCRVKLRPNDLDRRSSHLIETGPLLGEQSSAGREAPAQQAERA